ncbi:MAG: glutamate synthase [Rhodospirillaceae bacterium]|jgi:CDGSH-type Zn-finger protein|nr:glutamate synthase [Rhodospirillaceae bacterium]|tara:strand:+ start:2391 stop:2597 length:207 start_codon:yes stop_codon:yes gene_type:complete
MDKSVAAQDAPYEAEAEEGKTYAWRARGRSAMQPFYDGSHKGAGFSPVSYKTEKTANQPLCDGSHSST